MFACPSSPLHSFFCDADCFLIPVISYGFSPSFFSPLGSYLRSPHEYSWRVCLGQRVAIGSLICARAGKFDFTHFFFLLTCGLFFFLLTHRLLCRSLFFSSEIAAVAPTLFDEMEWDNGEGDYPNVNDCYEENNDTLDESSDDEVFINRNCLVILGMMLKNINKYVDKGLMENNEQKDYARRILLHNLMTSNEQPDGSEIPPLIQSSSRFYPYFKDCVGALDGTHIRVKVSDEDAPRYRGRKDWPTTNVLAACSFNLKHASLCNAIERAFGVLKKRFPIIASGTEPHYEINIRTDIILACCILHNFLMGVDPDERLISEVDHELTVNYDNEVSCNERQDDDWSQGNMIRDNIANIKIPLTKDHLKNRMKTLKTNFNSCYDLFKNASGVQWHAKSKRFEAKEEVWKQLIDANPSIKKWRYTPAPHYEKLFELFAYDGANGQGASIAAEKNVEIIQEEEQRDDIHVSSEVDLDSSPFVEGLKKRKITSVDAYDNKKSSSLDLSIKEVVAAIDRSSSVIKNKSFRFDKPKIQRKKHHHLHFMDNTYFHVRTIEQEHPYKALEQLHSFTLPES
ncbi:hypothetical protein ZIOFF_053281 [Zingiber officinale]|uniref:Uncharacterized protein n=1 Tax=Zingiber officinale TaxID=94328 RepID=A0A8J5FC88_ZINOF|nr:hypothetical protein ZIOFF_053281 [Zingiber officinale]